MTDPRLTGWAYAADAAESFYRRLAYIPPEARRRRAGHRHRRRLDPPHELSMPRDLCARFRQAGVNCEVDPRGLGEYRWPDLDDELRQAAIDRYAAANDAWWQLDIIDWTVKLRRRLHAPFHGAALDLRPGDR